MYGEQYYKDRLIDIYEFSPISYLFGNGELQRPDSNIEMYWELVVSITGEIILNLFSNGIFYSNLFDDSNLDFNGITNDGSWSISISSIHVSKICSPIKNDLHTSISCIPQQICLVKIQDACELDKLEGLINNFDFIGSEVSKNGDLYELNQIRVNLKNKEVLFRTNDSHKAIKQQISLNRIDRALLSTVSIPINSYDEINHIEDLMFSICQLLSLLNINSCYCPVLKYWSNGQIVKIKIQNTISSPYHKNVIIDNINIKDGILHFFNKFYEKFYELNESLNLTIFIHNVLGMYEGKFLENKLAGLLTSYEYILTKYLVYAGENQDTVVNLSIQDKLRKVNKYLKFIPSKRLGDEIRENMRNPLFHTGEIAILSSDEKIELFRQYYDLLIQIILKIIGYSGKYISPIDFNTNTL